MVDFEPSQVIFSLFFSSFFFLHLILISFSPSFLFFRPMSFRNDVDRYVLSLWVAWSGIDLKEEVAPRDVFYEMLGDDLKVDPSLKCISEGASYLSSFLPAHTEVLNEDHFLPSKEIVCFSFFFPISSFPSNLPPLARAHVQD